MQKTVSYRKHVREVNDQWQSHRDSTRQNAAQMVLRDLRDAKCFDDLQRAQQRLRWYEQLLGNLL